MLKAFKGQFDVVMAWSIDRLGRSLIDLLGTIQHLEGCRVDLYLDQQSIDTTTPTGRLMFQICGAFAEFERSMIRQRISAGLSRAKAQGKRLGRPKVPNTVERQVRRHLAKGAGILKVAKILGLGTGTVQRIKRAMAKDVAFGSGPVNRVPAPCPLSGQRGPTAAKKLRAQSSAATSLGWWRPS